MELPPSPFASTTARNRRSVSAGLLMELAASILGRELAEMDLALVDPTGPADDELVQLVELLIERAVGPAAARSLVSAAVSGTAMDIDDVIAILNEGGHSLRFSRRLLSTIFEHVSTGIVVFDKDLNVVAWNQRFCELVGLPTTLLRVGVPVAALVRYLAERGEYGPGDPEEHVERRLYHMHHGLRYGFERERSDGVVFRADGGAMPGGGYVTTYSDVTAEVRARDELRRAKEELEERVEERTKALSEANRLLDQAVRDKTRFLAGASHDLLQPLHAARLFLEALNRETSDTARPLIAKIENSVIAAESLLRALLELSAIDANTVQAHMEEVELTPFLADLVGSFKPTAAEKNLFIVAEPLLGRAHADPRLLRSIIQNFLSNAVRYTPKGGVLVRVRRRSGRLRIDVVDTGVGICAADIDRIFDEFARLGEIDAEGFGLGLALSKRLARLIGGELEVRSRPGHGSRFSLYVRECR